MTQARQPLLPAWTGPPNYALSVSSSDQYPGALLPDAVDASTSTRGVVSAVAAATPHTAGDYVEIDPSLSADASGILVSLPPTFAIATNTSTLLEIATGAAASEVVWATIGAGYAPINRASFVPGFIAAGTRVAVRCRSAVASKSIDAFFSFLPPRAGTLRAPVTYQADTATSRGLTITAPGSLNTKGAWTEIVASTASALSTLAIWPQGADGTVMSTSGVLVDIAVGAAASEVIIIPDVYLAGSTSEYYRSGSPLTYGVSIAAGSRIAARYARANVDNALDLIVTGA